MTTNDKPLTRNYDSDREKSEIDSDTGIRVLHSDLQRILAEEIAFYTFYNKYVSIDSLLCVF